MPIRLVASFKRMQRFKNYDTLVESLKTSEMFEVTGEGGAEKLRRKVPLDLNAKSSNGNPDFQVAYDHRVSRSIYAVSTFSCLMIAYS